MFSWFGRTIFRFKKKKYSAYSTCEPEESLPLTGDLTADLVSLRSLFSNSSDFIVRRLEVSGVRMAVLMCEGMINMEMLGKNVIHPITSHRLEQEGDRQALLEWFRRGSLLAPDQQEVTETGDLFRFLMSGFAAILMEGEPRALMLGLQGYSFRSVAPPESEVNIRGAHEGFVEPIRINMTMIRRRVKSPKLCFELLSGGKKSKTDLCIVYMTDAALPRLVDEVRRRLKTADLDIILDSGYLTPFLEDDSGSLFPTVGVTERPDTLCAKINEGRIALLVDGTPYALILPWFFPENFQSLDDYCYRPLYAAFIRGLKYLSFLVTVLLPGIYVGAATFHPEILPPVLLYNIASAEDTTPFPLMLEAILIHLIYEIMREAGLRLPRAVGHAVSIVGALVIGDAAVTAGIIGSPMVMVVALTTVSSFVVPSLYESVTVLRFGFILLGGLFGFYGIGVGLFLLMMNICGQTPYGIPYTAPLSPFDSGEMRDVLLRMGWKRLGKRQLRVQRMVGSELMGEEKGGRME